VRLVFLSLALVLLTACNRSAVTGPTPSAANAVPVVAPPGPYSLAGSVSDTAGRPIEGATVEIVGGQQAGSVTTTLADGSYTFGGGFSAAPAMRANKSGYIFDSTNSYTTGDPPTIYRWFRLGSSTPPIDLGGTYDLTFTADPSCALPLEARSRRYLTSIPAGNATLRTLTLSGASFVTAPAGYVSNVVYMSVFENFVRFYFSDPPIWETLTGPTSLYINGSADGEVTGSTAHFRVTGEFEFCGVTGNGCEKEIECDSTNHTLTLTRH